MEAPYILSENSELETFEISTPTKKINRIHFNVFCVSNTLFLFMIFIQVTIIFMFGIVYLSDFSTLIKDAKTNMADLSKLLPEVANVLSIVKQICESPEYAPYCHENNLTNQTILDF
jgi:hypothetical protein